ncbi:MAG: O-antigen ligase family protein [Candidatus Gracilibacteria bacterium]
MLSSLKNITTHDLIKALICALVVLVPVIYSTGFESAFTVPKLTLVRIVTLLIVAIWGVQILAQGKLIYRRSPMNKWIGMYGLVLILTTLTSTYFWTSFFGDGSRFLGLFSMLNLLFLMVVVIQFFNDKKEILRYVRLSVWMAVALSIYGLLQFKGWAGAEGWSHDPTVRVFGTMGHSNHFGAYLVFHVMLLIGLLLRSKKWGHRLLCGVGLLPMLATIVATASRGAFLALLFASMVFMGGVVIRGWQWIKKNKKPIVGVVGAGILFVGIFHNAILYRLENLNLTQRTISSIESIQSGQIPDRISWWFSAFEMIKDAPILGHGLATFHDIYNPYRRADYRVPGDIQDLSSPETAHMEYLDIAATQGLLGLWVYLGMIGCWILLLRKVIRSAKTLFRTKILALSFLAAGLAYFTQALLSFGMIGTLVPLYILMGMSVVLYHSTEDPKSQTEQFVTVRLGALAKISGACVVGIVWVLSAWFTLRQAEAEWFLNKAEIKETQRDVALMLEDYQSAVQNMPWMSHYFIAYGVSAYTFGLYDNPIEIEMTLLKTSIDAYENAYQLVQTVPDVPANLGVACIAYADVVEEKGSIIEAQDWREKGVEMYRNAVEVAVNNPLFMYNFGIVLTSQDEKREALDTFLQVLAIRDPYQDTYYRIALLSTELKDYDTARLYIQKALQENPADENVKALLQRINAETSRPGA